MTKEYLNNELNCLLFKNDNHYLSEQVNNCKASGLIVFIVTLVCGKHLELGNHLIIIYLEAVE